MASSSLLIWDGAWAMAEQPHPRLEVARQRWLEAEAERELAASATGLALGIDGQVRWVRPPPAFDDRIRGDHRVRLYARKRLYDSGRSKSLRLAAGAEAEARRWLWQDARMRHRLQVMEAFFDVLLADLEFDRDNEAMAMAYVRYDEAQQRHQLGQLSELGLLASETRYQSARERRFASQARQQQARARLAVLLNRPGQLPDELAMPDLPGNQRRLPELEALLAQAQQHNPVLLAAGERVRSARQRLRRARAERGLVIEAEGELAAYSRVFGFSDPWRATLYVDIPFYQGGGVAARRDRQRAELARLQAELEQFQHELAQGVREHWLRLEQLLIERQQREVAMAYRELYLDQARIRYEQEVETDLGDAMVELSAAELARVRTEFDLALTWASLEALLGAPWEE